MLAIAVASVVLHASPAPSHARAKDLFDEIYQRGQGLESTMKTVTAGFTESTSSSLLSRPLVTSGTLAVVRPSRIVLHYIDPEERTLLIDKDQLTLRWPSRELEQHTDIAAAQQRIQKYFVGKNPDELRRTFTITAREAHDRPNTWEVTMVPKRKQIQQGLSRLQLWIDRSSTLLSAMRLDFPNGDSKLMTFDHIVINGPIDPNVFSK